MTDNHIEVSSVSDSRIARYSSDSIKKSLNLAKKLSNPDLETEKDAKHYFGLGLEILGIEDYIKDYFLNEDYVPVEENCQQAINYLNLAITMNPLYVDAYIIRGMLKYFVEEDNQGAIDDYTQAIDIDPNNCWAYIVRADAKGTCIDSILDLNKSINVNPNNDCAYWMRASQRDSLGDLRGAIDDYTQVILLKPDIFWIYRNRACLKERMGDIRGGIEDRNQSIQIQIENCTQLITQNPDKTDTYIKRAKYKINLGDYRGAIDDYTKVIEIEPNLSWVYKDRAAVKEKTGDYHGVIDDLRQVIAIQIHGYTQLIDRCTQLISINSNNYIAYFEIANAKNKLSEYQRKISDYDLAIKLDLHDRDSAIKILRNISTPTLTLGCSSAYFDMSCGIPSEEISILGEQAGRYNYPSDAYSKLLQDRIIFLSGQVTSDLANLIVAQLLFLEAKDPAKTIYLYINSPGGSVSAGMGILDTINQVRSDICTICLGFAGGISAILLSAGSKGKRMSILGSQIVITQPLGGAHGQATDIATQAKEILYCKAKLNDLLAHCTGQPLSKIQEDTDRDFYMSDVGAKEYGLIDTVIDGDFHATVDRELSVTNFPHTNKVEIIEGILQILALNRWQSYLTKPYR